MGVVEHLKTLCCLGLPPESALIAIAPCCTKSFGTAGSGDVSIGTAYSESPASAAAMRERISYLGATSDAQLLDVSREDRQRAKPRVAG
jgi:hypothetical protein